MSEVSTVYDPCGHAFLTRHCYKWDFKPIYIYIYIYITQKCPQNAGDAISEAQIQKNFQDPYNCVITMASPSLKSWLRH